MYGSRTISLIPGVFCGLTEGGGTVATPGGGECECNPCGSGQGRAIPAQTVVLSDGRISALGPVASTSVPAGARRIAGHKLDNDPPTWPGSIGVKTTSDEREGVRQMKQQGADFIKVYFSKTSA